jgi:hypothetical protein
VYKCPVVCCMTCIAILMCGRMLSIQAAFAADIPPPNKVRLSERLADPTMPPLFDGVVIAQGKSSLVLQAVIKQSGQRYAVINGQKLTVGEKIADATVRVIESARVEVEKDGTREWLALFASVNIKRSTRGGDARQ